MPARRPKKVMAMAMPMPDDYYDAPVAMPRPDDYDSPGARRPALPAEAYQALRAWLVTLDTEDVANLLHVTLRDHADVRDRTDYDIDEGVSLDDGELTPPSVYEVPLPHSVVTVTIAHRRLPDA